MGCDFYIKKIHVAGCEPGAVGDIKLVIHDIGGSVAFASIRRKHMIGADIVFVVFALNDLHSYSIDEFLSDIDHLEDRPCVALIGNKLDLVGLDSLDLSSIEAKAAGIGARLFLTSAKENIAVSDVFVSTVEHFMNDRFQ
jgi:GTPase SAR1 family protein